MSLADHTLTHAVVATESPSAFARIGVGEVEITEAGILHLVVAPGQLQEKALMSLRRVRLVPR